MYKMCNHTRYLILMILLIIAVSVSGQINTIHYKAELSAGYCGPDHVPFWLRSNQYGSIPPSGAFAGFMAGAIKDYNPVKKKTDWGFGLEGRLYVGNPTDFMLLESYLKFRYGIFQIKGGRSKDFTGLCDTMLTSGSWSISGNAPGIPKIELSVEQFYTLPFFGGLFAFKGNYIHGWMGNWYIEEEYVPNTSTYLHQKSLYGRFGKEKWKMKLYGGFNHQVVWGQEKETLGGSYELSPLETFLYVNIGKAYSHDTIQNTRLGNQLGSIDLGLTYETKTLNIFIYRQFFYENGALYYLANLQDGLNGISITNKVLGKGWRWSKLLIEFLYTKNQAGEVWSPNTTSFYENYYNNGYYRAGWSYKGVGIGNPLISTAGSIRDELPEAPGRYFSNNRLYAISFGLDADFFNYRLQTKLTYSRNFGTYLTSSEGKIYGGKNTEALYGIFPVTDQYSAYINCGKKFEKEFSVNILSSLDIGKLYYNSFGIIATFSKNF